MSCHIRLPPVTGILFLQPRNRLLLVRQRKQTDSEENSVLFSSVDVYKRQTLPTEKENKPIGLWGQRHKRYLQECKKAVYITLLTSGRLNSYLADIDEQATEMMFRLVEQMADKEGVTEQLKTERPMLWVGRINEIQARAREIVNAEIIYA